jgi:hypothetical protein
MKEVISHHYYHRHSIIDHRSVSNNEIRFVYEIGMSDILTPDSRFHPVRDHHVSTEGAGLDDSLKSVTIS